MKTRKKVILDEWFGKSAVVLLNICARILGRILSINHEISPPKRIVVCKFLGMGSIIQATPLLQTFRNSFPDSEITFVTSTANRSLLESIQIVDHVLTIDDRSAGKILASTFTVLRKLWRKRADLYIDLETYSYFSTALATMSCARNRFGFYRIERNIRMGVYTHMMFFNARAPIAQSYLQMGRLAGCKEIITKLYSFPVLEETYDQTLKKLLPAAGTLRDYIIINPNASDLRIERRWPAEKFVEFIRLFAEKYPHKLILLIGAGNEKHWVHHIHSQLDEQVRPHVINTAGMFSLQELFALISGSELVITNDTGPMHISFAFERPTVSLFGPASPSQYGQNPNAYGVYKNIYCSPCVHDFLKPPCNGDNQCMKKITVHEVLQLCDEILLKKSDNGRVIIPPMDYIKINHTSLGILERNNDVRHD